MTNKLIAAWVCLGLLFVLGGYLFTYQENIRLDLHRINHTQAILGDIYDLQNNLNDAEAGARRFVASGEAAHAIMYQQAVKEIARLLSELQELTLGEPEQKELIANLQSIISQRLTLLDRGIALRREKGVEESEHEAIRKEVARLEPGLRKAIEKIEEAEKKQLDPEWAKGKTKRQRYITMLTLGSFASFTFVLALFFLFNREIKQRKKVEESLAHYQDDLRNLASQLSLAEERERRRLALHLHDQIGHTLALTKIRLGELEEEASIDNDGLLHHRLKEARNLIEQAIQDTQFLTFRISPPILYELGLDAALEWLTEQFSTQNDLKVRFETDHQSRAVSQELEILLFQAVNELLFNVVKHAQAEEVNVSLWNDGNFLKVGVDDDGRGFDFEQRNHRSQGKGGFGLFSIRERLKPFNGWLEVQSSPGEGAQVTVSVPFNP